MIMTGEGGLQLSWAMRWVPWIVLILLFVGSCALEAFLAGQKNRYLGLLLPGLFVLLSVIATATAVRVFIGLTAGLAEYTALPPSALPVIAYFLIFNIPTLILLLIYFLVRRRKQRKRGLEKMNILDLD